MVLSDERLAEIRARVDAAAPGPWRESETVADRGADQWYVLPPADYSDLILARGFSDDLPRDARALANRTFIAHARTDIPDLLDEIARLREALAQVPEVCRLAWRAGWDSGEGTGSEGHTTQAEQDASEAAYRVALWRIMTTLGPEVGASESE